ncbi:MAG: hypothetical protein RL189_2905, partial [Pseudomonadota bacterium]
KISKKAGLLVSLASSAGCASLERGLAAGPQGAQLQPVIYEFESGAEGFNTKTVFVDSGREVFAFDAQFTEQQAQSALDFLSQKTKNPVTHLIVTHPNPDKFNGTSVFRKAGAKIVMSEATAGAISDVHSYKKNFFVNIAKMFTEQNYPQPVDADVVFKDRLTLTGSSNLKIELQELHSAGVSTNQTTGYIPALNALVVGDLVHHKAHAWLEGGIQAGKAFPTLTSWREIISKLNSDFSAKNPLIVGGRGLSGAANVVLPEQIRYLSEAEALTAVFVARIGTLLKTDPQKAYSELTKIISEKFPDYKLSYMLQYGIYGLAGQLAEKR